MGMFESSKYITNVKYYLGYEVLTIIQSLLNQFLDSIEYILTSMGKVLMKILRGPHMIINLVTLPQSQGFDCASSMVKEYPCHLLLLTLTPLPDPHRYSVDVQFLLSALKLPKTNCGIVTVRATTEAIPYYPVNLTCLNSRGWKVMMAIVCPWLLVWTVSSRQCPPS